MIVPLFPELEDTIRRDGDGSIIIDGPVIRMFFYAWAYTDETAPDIIEKVEAAREQVFLALARQFAAGASDSLR
ncbi:MAG: hypothetical protein D6784_02500 [Chloroflexi bacterium]|nr:MAG: hypothetical protein D6784_02500 [Chloroflexota bacterium]